MVTLTATPEPGFSPPRVRLDVATGNSSTLQSVSISRAGKAIRQPPFAGTTTALAYDYEAPYGVPVTYTVSGSTVGAYSNEWSESWSSLANWTGDTASWSVSGGEARSTVDVKTITRMATADIGRVTVGGIPTFVSVRLLSSGGSELARLEYLSTFGGVRLFVGSTSVSTVAGGSVTFTIAGGVLTARGTGWELSLPMSGTVRGVALTSLFASSSNVARVGAVAVAPNGTTVPFNESATTTLSPDASWLVHPTFTSLSVPFEGDCPISMSAETRAQVQSEAQRNVIPIQGSSTPVVVVNGRRSADSWTLGLNCPTLEDRDSVRALLDDQTPILVRAHSPACDVPDGWYSVGDYAATRPAPIAANEYHRVTLPMQPVREPVVVFGNAGWDYADVALVGTYADVLATYPTYLDLVLGDTA